MGMGTQEILLILVVVLVLFGSRKLPEIGSGLGRAIKNFKKASIEPDEIDITPQAKSKAKKKEAASSEDDEA
ncbi:twin-arginine translocase TatA/TatE family subunit [Desulfovibrio sp. OttesenSCG-928-G11]|nr:twin-arginine translocase TatA/TatE family subunit [Desulfovibrio sp. OttesenSCG-928-G11]